ncbi:SDR family NAD(P)-dependent oxidoreductase [Burkholderia diffusa]|uniref:SDR family NAD(P)-dependent oxidoreductase n=1 Tax=Burkholderia diffusa TaxID=488732 RepID=UPI001FC8B8EE|nr:SDR family NAD(P)-dependent oxidoreductase [Burkholderia diffusa]
MFIFHRSGGRACAAPLRRRRDGVDLSRESFMARSCFITGASSGFGTALAEHVVAGGDRAVLTARRRAPLDAIAGRHGDRALVLPMDVTDAAARATALQAALQAFGRIDVLANIAGRGSCGAEEEFSPAQLREQMELNFFAAAELTREVLHHVRARGSGHVLNLTSVAGLVTVPACGPYCAAKFALEAWSEAIHHEVAPLGDQGHARGARRIPNGIRRRREHAARAAARRVSCGRRTDARLFRAGGRQAGRRSCEGRVLDGRCRQ